MSDIINVLVIIDTDRVIKNFPKPSKDQKSPIALSKGYQYMVVSDNNTISGNEEIDLNLNFSIETEKSIRFHGTSEYANFEKSILIYKIKSNNESRISNQLKLSSINTPIPLGSEVLPAKIVSMHFWFYEIKISLLIKRKGTQKCQLWFALYVKEELYGYFYLDAAIKAN